MKRNLNDGEVHSPKEAIEGEVIKLKGAYFAVRLDDGRVLPSCFISRNGINHRSRLPMDKLMPKVGERVHIYEISSIPGHATLVMNKLSLNK